VIYDFYFARKYWQPSHIIPSEMAPKIEQLVMGAGALAAAMVGGYVYCTGSGMLSMVFGRVGWRRSGLIGFMADKIAER
jgi:hypothetical protein